RRPINQQRMVAHRFERVRESGENCLFVMHYRRGFSMHQARGTHHFAAEGFADALMPKADAKYGQFAGKLAQECNRNASLGWSAWAWRDYDCAGCKRAYGGDIDSVVAAHGDF